VETLEHQQPQAFPPTPSGFRLWGESGALNLPLRSHAGREEGVHRGPFSPGDLGTALRAAGGCGFALAPARDGAQRGRTAAVGRNHPTDGHGSGFIFWQRSRPNPPGGTGSPGVWGTEAALPHDHQHREPGPAPQAQPRTQHPPAAAGPQAGRSRTPPRSFAHATRLPAAALPASPRSLHGHGWLPLHVPRLGVQQLPPDLQRDLRVAVELEQLEQSLLLLRGEVLLVALGEGQEALVPEHGQDALVRAEGQEVEDEGIHHAEGQGVLLVDEQPEEDAVGAAVLHLGDLQHGRAAGTEPAPR